MLRNAQPSTLIATSRVRRKPSRLEALGHRDTYPHRERSRLQSTEQASNNTCGDPKAGLKIGVERNKPDNILESVIADDYITRDGVTANDTAADGTENNSRTDHYLTDEGVPGGESTYYTETIEPGAIKS